VVTYGVDMFVRGTGYFSGSTMLFVASLYMLSLRRSSSAISAVPQAHAGGLASYSPAP